MQFKCWGVSKAVSSWRGEFRRGDEGNAVTEQPPLEVSWERSGRCWLTGSQEGELGGRAWWQKA